MFSSGHNYPTVSEVFMLAPETAAATLDVMILDPAVAAHLLPTGALHRARPTGYDALRRLPAALLPAGRRSRIEVVLELLPWSAHRCELSIWAARRPIVLRAPSLEAYLDAAHRTLTTLGYLMDPRHLPVDRRQLWNVPASWRIGPVVPQPPPDRRAAADKF